MDSAQKRPLNTFYKIGFACKDDEEVQRQLNYLYGYKLDVITKILHRDRINLFCLLMSELIEQNIICSFDSALDIGCNAGVYSKIISDYGYKYVLGIDVVPDYVEKASSGFALNEDKKVLQFKVLNAESIDTAKKYDFVLATEVIEHSDNPGKVVDNISNILTPKGIAIISLPNRISFPYLLMLLFHLITRKKTDRELERHLSYPFYRTMRLFSDGNLKIIKTSGTNLVVVPTFIWRRFYGTPLFGIANAINFYLSRIWPLKYFTQFFFIVCRNQGAA